MASNQGPAAKPIVTTEPVRIEGRDVPAGTKLGEIGDPANYRTIKVDKKLPESAGRGVLVRCLHDRTAKIGGKPRFAFGQSAAPEPEAGTEPNEPSETPPTNESTKQ